MNVTQARDDAVPDVSASMLGKPTHQVGAGPVWRLEVLRFARAAHQAMPSSTLTWLQRHRVHQDLGSLIVEARGQSPRPQLLRVLMRLVVDELADGGLSSSVFEQLQGSCARLSEG